MRGSGILMPIASLPSQYGIGCFDKNAYKFVDCLEKAGQSYWQVLPMGPTGFGDSPYQSFSTFAGNPYFISIDDLVQEGYLSASQCKPFLEDVNEEKIDYGKIYKNRFAILKEAFLKSDIESNPEYGEFVQYNSDWLPDYALFMAIKDSKNGESFLDWEEDIKLRKPEAMVSYKNDQIDRVNFYQFIQFEFFKQWKKLKKYANDKGIKIIGDIPIYVSSDSADVWANPDLFQLKEDMTPKAVAGVPPDAFSKDGQVWGNPLYNWPVHQKSEYAWWIKRMEACLDIYDVVRIDHFRGFDQYYSIPYGEKTAKNGEWLPGPGIEIFEEIRRYFILEKGGTIQKTLPIIAEDLGFLTDSVRELLAQTGFPGMKILQFAFDTKEDSDYLPYKYEKNSICYTGTHDNSTTFAWWKELSKEDKDVALRYMNASKFSSRKRLTWELICLAMASGSDTCIIPMQDYLCLGNNARINTPSTIGSNWQWRMKNGIFTDKLAEKIRKMTKLYGRLNVLNKDEDDEKNGNN